MRLPLVLILAAACGRESAPPAQENAPVNGPGPASSPVAPPVSAAVVASVPPIGASLASFLTPTPANLSARKCDSKTPVAIGTADQANPAMAIAFGPSNGLVAWTSRPGRLAVRPVDRAGEPTGPMREVEVPAELSRTHGMRALDGKFLVFLSETDYSGPMPVLRLFALAFGTDGAPLGSPLQIAIGERGRIDEISDGAARGVLLFAGASPSTNVKTGRLVTISVADDGISQTVFDLPQPSKRARPLFSFAKEHNVAVLGGGGVIVVDGKASLPIQGESLRFKGFGIAPQFDGSSSPGSSSPGSSSPGSSIPFYAITSFGDEGKLRYGSLSLDGTLHLDKKEFSKDAPLKPPFNPKVHWATSTGAGTVEVFSSTSPVGAALGTPVDLTATIPDLSSGVWTQMAWSGEQVLVLHSAGSTVRLALLPCT